MLKRYSSNQHVDRGFTYHLALSTPMCHAKRSTMRFSCVKFVLWSSDSYVSHVLASDIDTSSKLFFFNFFLWTACASLVSVDVMYIVSMSTHMSMHDNNVQMVELTFGKPFENGKCVWCRRMLAAPLEATRSGTFGAADGRRGGEQIPSGDSPDRTGPIPAAGVVAVSRPEASGSRGRRHREAGSTSESD